MLTPSQLESVMMATASLADDMKIALTRTRDELRRAVTNVTKLRAARYAIVTMHLQDMRTEAYGYNAAKFQSKWVAA
jgi:hypothetical protein